MAQKDFFLLKRNQKANRNKPRFNLNKMFLKASFVFNKQKMSLTQHNKHKSNFSTKTTPTKQKERKKKATKPI